MDSDKIKSRFDAAKAKRAPIESELVSAYRWTSPMGSPLAVADQPADRHDQYASTAEQAVDTLVCTISNFLVPTDKHWVKFSMSAAYKAQGLPTGQFDLILAQEEREFFEALEQSGFYLAADESLKDCIISGTGAVGVTMTDDGLYFQSLPVAQLYYLDDGACDVDVVFRAHSLPARTIVARYKSVPKWIKEIADKKPDEPIKVIEAMTPGGKRGTYDYSVFAEKDWAELHTQVCKFKPFIVYRWEKHSASTWGDSQVRKALGNIRTENMMMADLLDVSAFTARPPMITSDPNLRDQKIEAGNTYYAESQDGGIKPLVLGSEYKVTLELLQAISGKIREQLMADILPLKDRMNTAEVQARTSEFYRRIGTYGKRLSEEFLKPIVRSTIIALRSAGKIKQFDPDSKDFHLDTDSLQERVEQDAEIQRIVGLCSTVAQVMQIQVPFLDPTKIALYLLRQGGMPAELIPTEQQAAQMMQAAQAAQAVGGAVQTLQGQGNPESNKQTGAAMASILPQLMGKAA